MPRKGLTTDHTDVTDKKGKAGEMIALLSSSVESVKSVVIDFFRCNQSSLITSRPAQSLTVSNTERNQVRRVRIMIYSAWAINSQSRAKCVSPLPEAR